MEITKEILLNSRRKLDGISCAKVNFAVASKIDVKDIPSKIYLDEFGREIHPNATSVASLSKPESLREKIERFDRLAEQVRMSRAIMMDVVHEITGDDEDPMDDELLDDTQELDPFGEPIVAEPVPATPVPAEPATKVSVAAVDAKADTNGGDDAAGDSPQSSVQE